MAAAKRRQMEQVEVLDYHPWLKRHFKSLNLEWLEKYFTVEPADLEMLSRPVQSILRRGGAVLFAKLDGRIAGTCALVPTGPSQYEMVKMAVDPKFRGRQVGKKLALAIIERARALGGAELIARTSPRLEAANRLYLSLGFKAAGADHSGDYRRRTIVLRYDLSTRRSRLLPRSS